MEFSFCKTHHPWRSPRKSKPPPSGPPFTNRPTGPEGLWQILQRRQREREDLQERRQTSDTVIEERKEMAPFQLTLLSHRRGGIRIYIVEGVGQEMRSRGRAPDFLWMRIFRGFCVLLPNSHVTCCSSLSLWKTVENPPNERTNPPERISPHPF